MLGLCRYRSLSIESHAVSRQRLCRNGQRLLGTFLRSAARFCCAVGSKRKRQALQLQLNHLQATSMHSLYQVNINLHPAAESLNKEWGGHALLLETRERDQGEETQRPSACRGRARTMA